METQVKAKPKLKLIKDVPNLLKPGEMGAVLELTVKDKDGKVVDSRVMRSRCFVRQFLELLWIQMFQISNVAPQRVRGIDNMLWDIHAGSHSFRSDGGAGVVNQGIIVGTGTTAPNIDDYKIETIIDHDAGAHGAGTLEYGAVTFGAPTSDATTSQFTVTRNFVNASGGAITVNEIALYVLAYGDKLPSEDKTNTKNFMIIRDVISGGIAVANGQTLTVNYREQAVV